MCLEDEPNFACDERGSSVLHGVDGAVASRVKNE